MVDLKVILFDLGGVLVQLPPKPLPQAWLAPGDTPEAAARRCFHSRAVWRFERGDCEGEAFAQDLVDEVGLRAPPQEVFSFFADWPQLDPQAHGLLEAIPRHYRLGCFSNTNPMHWPRLWDEMGFAPFFDHCFLSFRLRAMKPEPEAYIRVLATLGVAPGQVLFLDDREENVRQARIQGICAEQVHGVAQSREVLAAYGVLDRLAVPG